LKLLFALFYYNSTIILIILAIIRIIRKNKNGGAGEYSLRISASKLSRGGTEAGNHHSAGAQAGNHP
jgi:hypothetical protein